MSENDNDKSLWDSVTESVSETYNELTGDTEVAERVPAGGGEPPPAQAYAGGNDVYFGPEADPSGDVAAHEAPHVVQQGYDQPVAHDTPPAASAEDDAAAAAAQAAQDECDNAVTAAGQAVGYALAMIAAVPSEYYGGYGNEWQLDSLRDALGTAKAAAKAASSAVWNAHITCNGIYGDLYGAYDAAADAATSVGTAEVSGTGYQSYCDAAASALTSALGKLPW
ncbi:MAG TPA: DUF4157 domain-containing protein [Acidimicrobiales bacterium]